MDFIFDGAFVYIVLIAILSSLFRRKKHTKQQKTSTTRSTRTSVDKRMREFGPIPDILKDLEEMFEPTKNEPTEKPHYERTEHKGTEAQPNITQMVDEKPVYVASAQTNVVEPAIEMKQTVKKSAEEKKETPPLFESEKVIDGIIWSQILEPPKARKRWKH